MLSRGKRDAVWPVFEEYRGQLASRRLKEVADAYREVAGLLQAEGRQTSGYSAIVIDETQDFGPQALKFLRAMIPAGGERPVLRRRRTSAHLQSPSGGHEQVRHRHPRQGTQALSQLPDDRRDQAPSGCPAGRTRGRRPRRRHRREQAVQVAVYGTAPRLVAVDCLEGAAKEAKSFIERLRTEEAPDGSPSTICVAASSEKNREAMAQQLQAGGIKGVTITAQSNHSDARDVVHFATMHRAKGLEFDAVVVVTPDSYLGDPAETLNQRKAQAALRGADAREAGSDADPIKLTTRCPCYPQRRARATHAELSDLV